MVPDPELLARFRADLDALSAPSERIGVAVSGGPDSLALLLLAVAARPGEIEAATVDHRLREGSGAEADMVGRLCGSLGVPHSVLAIDWTETPVSAVQERARNARYRCLADWVTERGLTALATAHHADDQAETLVMRLNRGSGVRGLAGMRPAARVPGSAAPLLRPLLGWRRSELEAICASAGVEPALDPSNRDKRYERIRVRQALSKADWLDAPAVARSAANLASADEALDWVAEGLSRARLTNDSNALRVDVRDLPTELQRRLLLIAFARLHAPEPRGPDLARVLDALSRGKTTTLSGLKLEPGVAWRITRAPLRRTTIPPDDL
jgi:tRNA(Ile)-lysidine synthase